MEHLGKCISKGTKWACQKRVSECSAAITIVIEIDGVEQSAAGGICIVASCALPFKCNE